MMRFRAAVLVALTAAAAAEKVPCDPADCVLFMATWSFAYNECSSCVPAQSKWRCPSKHNAFANAFAATFPPDGFGAWTTAQCQREEYSPGALAFSGPGAFADDFVPACPEARFCACGANKAKVQRLVSPDGCTDHPRECNSAYWASLAPGFTLVQGFERVSGGTFEHFNVVYEHADGRRQFCGGVNTMTYHPQMGEAGDYAYAPNAYETGCGFTSSCPSPGFVETGTVSGCGWGKSNKRCAPTADGSALVQASGLPSITQAAATAAAWATECNSCGTVDCNRGSGSHAAHNATSSYRCQGDDGSANCTKVLSVPPPAECGAASTVVAAGRGGLLVTLIGGGAMLLLGARAL